MRTRDISYAGETVALADLPEYAKFYGKLASGKWEPHTFEVLARNLDRETVFVDIGAWIGVTPLWAARRAKSVIAVEPDPKCVAILRTLASGAVNVTLIEGAVSSSQSVAIHAVDGFGSSETSVLAISDGESRTVAGIGIDRIMALAEGEPTFVKIDIEGYEFALIEELARLEAHRVRGVQLALHPQLYEKTLSGNRVARRLQTACATWLLARRLARFLPSPCFAKYRGVADYILRGILFRGTPKGADIVYEAGASRKVT